MKLYSNVTLAIS